MFNTDRRKSGDLPIDETMVKLLIAMIGEQKKCEQTHYFEMPEDIGSISETDFVNQMLIMLRDEFLGEITVNTDNKIDIKFSNGEKFSVHIEKNRC